MPILLQRQIWRPYRHIKIGVVESIPGGDVARHYHRAGYANVILSGTFVEAAFAGAPAVEPGQVLLHGAFDAHTNMGASHRGVTLLRLPWSDCGPEGRFSVVDPDRIVRLCERDVPAAMDELREQLRSVAPGPLGWPEQLAEELRHRPRFRLEVWAEMHGLARETVSRTFKRRFGVSPQRYRVEVKTRDAWRRVLKDSASLTTIAHEAGFSDLAHMTRNIALLTGMAPSDWRCRKMQHHGSSFFWELSAS